MRARPVTPEGLVAEIASVVSARAGWVRVAVDGPPAADPDALADALVDPLRLAGRPTLRVRAADFLRPASLRLEFGRTNPDSFYEGWLDEAGLRREVLDPVDARAVGQGRGRRGSGRVLPSLWNAGTDRASRAPYVAAAPGCVVLVSGVFLLGGGLPFDVTVHLSLSAAALRRRTPPAERWTLPAFARYAAEVAPQDFADLVVRADDPRHPAVVVPGG